MTTSQQNLTQIQNTLSKAYKAIKFDLDSDNSLASRALSLAINGYLNLEIATFADLVNLREAIYTYQNQLTGQIRLHNAAEALLHNVKAFVNEDQIGYTAFSAEFLTQEKRDNAINYSDILANIKSEVAGLSGPLLTKSNIAKIIAFAVGASSDSNLIKTLEIDIQGTTYSEASQIQSLIASITAETGPEIAFKLYKAFAWNINTVDSSVIGINSLASYISDFQENNPNVNVVSAIIAAASQESVQTMNDMAFAIATAVNAQDDEELVRILQIVVNESFDTVENLKSRINSLTGNDGPSIVTSLYNSISSAFINKMHLALPLSSHITDNHINNNVEYNDTLQNIKDYVGEADANPISIANAFAASINATDDSEFINRVELLLSDDEYSAQLDNFKLYISDIYGTDGPSIATSFVSSFFHHYALIGENPLRLTNAIINYYNNHEINYEDIAANIKNAVLALPEEGLNNNKIAKAVAGAINASSDIDLITALELDFTHAFYNEFSHDFRPTIIKQNFANVYGDNAASIAGDIYKTTINYFGWISGSPGSIILSEAINAYNGTIISTVTVTDAIGSKPIGPQAEIYLNKCTLDGDTYTVGSSVFVGFDSDNAGLMLSAMEGLNSLTGQIAALSQCATWIRGGNDLYATTTYPMATTGDDSETGCSPLLSSADAMILCYSVFDMMS